MDSQLFELAGYELTVVVAAGLLHALRVIKLLGFNAQGPCPTLAIA